MKPHHDKYMNKKLQVRQARETDARRLSELAIRSKAYWGYSDDFMKACKDELSVSKDNIENDANTFMVAWLEGSMVGFFALELLPENTVELTALFVEPEYIGSGVGRTLIEAAKKQANELGAHKMIIQGDPNTEKFYVAAGGVKYGSKESASIGGRLLPLFELNLNSDQLIEK